MSNEADTCAVVVIHGIGEQRPTATLRGFVEGVLAEEKRAPKFFNKPDPLAETYELRKLQNRRQPRVHFFEYYWAYKAEGTRIAHVFQWARSLLLRRPNGDRVPPHLRYLFALSWLTILMTALAAFLGVGQFFSSLGERLLSPILPTLIAIVTAVINLVLLGYLGDAARYLSASPTNIRMRQAIRSDGVKLMRSLHEKGYGRIVIVGHSLGSVIAFDLLRQIWAEYCDTYSRPCRTSQPALAEVERLGQDLDKTRSELERAKRGSPEYVALEEELHAKCTAFQNGQAELWRELRDLGSPWRVTDFITLGSPLAHAAVLMADDVPDLRRRQQERELPTCPPAIDKTKAGAVTYAYEWYEFTHQDVNGDYRLRWLHSAAVFACTRWTNIYFPARLGVFGDLVGGPLRSVFGSGVFDRWVADPDGGIAAHTLLAHVRYWRTPKRSATCANSALDVLRKALALNDLSFYHKKQSEVEPPELFQAVDI